MSDPCLHDPQNSYTPLEHIHHYTTTTVFYISIIYYILGSVGVIRSEVGLCN